MGTAVAAVVIAFAILMVILAGVFAAMEAWQSKQSINRQIEKAKKKNARRKR